MRERLPKHFVAHVLDMYKDSLIAESTAQHDLDHINSNYEQ